MKVENVSELLGACYEAKKIVELMPQLPQGMRPSHIHIVDIIYQLQQEHGLVRISDIIRLLGLRRIQRIVFLNHFRRSHGLARIRGGYAGYRV